MTLNWQDIKNTPTQNKWGSLYSASVGSNTANVQSDPNPQATKKATGIYNKFIGPVTSVLSPIENVVDAVIRKDLNKNFGQRLKESFTSGSDIGGALMTRGMNPKLAMPIGFMGSLALPGLGEVSQVNKAAKLLGKVEEMPSLRNIATSVDSFNALKKWYGVNSADIPKELVGDWKVIGDFVSKIGKKPYMSGNSWVYKDGKNVTKVPTNVFNSLENVRYMPTSDEIPHFFNQKSVEEMDIPNFLANKNKPINPDMDSPEIKKLVSESKIVDNLQDATVMTPDGNFRKIDGDTGHGWLWNYYNLNRTPTVRVAVSSPAAEIPEINFQFNKKPTQQQVETIKSIFDKGERVIHIEGGGVNLHYTNDSRTPGSSLNEFFDKFKNK